MDKKKEKLTKVGQKELKINIYQPISISAKFFRYIL